MDFIGNKAVNGTILAGVGGVAVGGALGYLAGKRKSSKSRRRGRKSKSRNNGKRNYRGRTRKTPYTARKRKDTSRRRIRYTSKGQPYIIQANGRARFIKKSSAKRSHKQKGGRY